MTQLLLVPSPLLGPATWEPMARWCADRGVGATVARFDTGVRRPEDVLAAVVLSAEGLGEIVLVPHSNAGLYAPRLTELLDVTATVYVDAALAGAGSDTTLAPERFLEFLRGLADADGLLPVWTHWWDDVDHLFPDPAVRAAVEAEQPRLPLSYFEARLPVPAAWSTGPCAYLAFGDAYAEEIAAARAHGWPVSTMTGTHLHQLRDPAGVGAEVLRLAGALRDAGP